ncbi:DNA gyrase subunit A, partial [Mycoplasmopsis synoviae]
VDFVDKYDSTEKEPAVLPSRFPNLLVSGSIGIAVGMATSIPPHKLRETIGALIAYARNTDISVEELLQHIKGRDFPSGGVTLGSKGIVEAYTTRSGQIPVRCEYEI